MIDICKRYEEIKNVVRYREYVIQLLIAEIEADGRVKAAKAIGQSIEDAVKKIVEEVNKR